MKRVAIIGAGIFGISVALELAKFCKVTVFERNNDLLSEATSNNQLRYHMGYHYPRSPETVAEIREASPSFEKEYGECLVFDFPAYYTIAKENSMTNKKQFLDFCDKYNLPYEVVNPPDWMIDKSKITLCVKTPEGVYDPEILKKILRKKISNASLKVLFNHEVIDGRKQANEKILTILSNGAKIEESFDIIVNATYSHFNTFNKWFGFPTPILQYDLMEILEIKLPIKQRFGMLILDGLFATIVPKGRKNTYTLGHVKHTMLRRLIAKEMEEIHKTRNAPTNRNKILSESAKLMPFLKNAKIIKSLYSTRVIKANHEHDDARPTEITDYGYGLYSIFAGKVVTAVKTSREIANRIKNLK